MHCCSVIAIDSREGVVHLVLCGRVVVDHEQCPGLASSRLSVLQEHAIVY
jgi:hypothetical protein